MDTAWIEMDPRGPQHVELHLEGDVSKEWQRRFFRALPDGTFAVYTVTFYNEARMDQVDLTKLDDPSKPYQPGVNDYAPLGDLVVLTRWSDFTVCTDPADVDGTEVDGRYQMVIRDERELGVWTEDEWQVETALAKRTQLEYLPRLVCAAYDPRGISWAGPDETLAFDHELGEGKPGHSPGPLTYLDRSVATGEPSDGACSGCESAFVEGSTLVVARDEDDPHMPRHFHDLCWASYLAREATALGCA